MANEYGRPAHRRLHFFDDFRFYSLAATRNACIQGIGHALGVYTVSRELTKYARVRGFTVE
jgi:hypothetical protein